ncbi:hypothetical protein O6H91_18G062400 [Diphasiastrum complanatum]|uniref:Uncharacterized protein n=1 Tax=Diphasiastrum complanatum TaxID=34168 RepID=A0ACC2B1X0_DIPCM|nr:hypothetical protein O6H91_18G062400 [Diphasiastrum complanatum]
MVRGLGRAIRGVARSGGGGSSSSSSQQERERGSSHDAGPRYFSQEVKEACWRKAEEVSGRDPERWRKDPLGNLVFRKLVGCQGCLCHDFDHIVPYSKGGPSTLENCQLMQAVANRAKGNRVDVSKTELIQKSSYCRLSGKDMDLVELSAFGDVHHLETGGCRLQ